jgi:hypothetical protein
MRIIAVLLCALALLTAVVSVPDEARAVNGCNPQYSKC